MSNKNMYNFFKSIYLPIDHAISRGSKTKNYMRSIHLSFLKQQLE